MNLLHPSTARVGQTLVCADNQDSLKQSATGLISQAGCGSSPRVGKGSIGESKPLLTCGLLPRFAKSAPRLSQWLRSSLVLLCLLCIGLPARAEDYGDISVRVVTLSPGSGSQGYQEFRATIVNHSSTRAHQVTLIFPADHYSARGNVIRAMTRTVEVAPQATAVVSLFKPPLQLAGTGVSVVIDGREWERPLKLAYTNSNVSGYGNELLLASPEVSKSRTLEYAERHLQNSNSKPSFSTARSELPVTEWSTHWLGYSQYNAVLLTAAEWRALPDGARQALWRYLECGGTLLVFGGLEVPAPWQATRAELSPTAEAAARPASRPEPPDPSATPTPTPAPLPPVAVRETLQTFSVGFGKLLVMPAQPQPALTEAQWQAAAAAWPMPTFLWTGHNYAAGASFEDLNNKLPIIEKLSTPVRGLFLLMLLFVIVIGPVNLLLLARRRKKLWLLWTVPAISLVTCLAIAGYAIASEGISGYARTFSLTLLDEQAHRATTLGLTGFYSPLTPSDGLHFGYDTEVLPVLPYSYYYSDRGGTARTLDWSNEQHLSSGWIAARVPVWFRVRKSEARRERLSISTNARGVPVVTNGLGVPIRRLWLPDARRVLFVGQDIAPGAQVELKESQRPVAQATLPPLRQLLAIDEVLAQANALAEKPEEWLAPGTYLAEIEAAPFNESSLRNVRQMRGRTLVYGLR